MTIATSGSSTAAEERAPFLLQLLGVKDESGALDDLTVEIVRAENKVTVQSDQPRATLMEAIAEEGYAVQ